MISVITPSFNQAKFIGSLLDSVNDQRYSNCEHLIIDNCSSDNTKEIVAKRGSQNTKLFIEKDNGQVEAGHRFLQLFGMGQSSNYR